MEFKICCQLSTNLWSILFRHLNSSISKCRITTTILDDILDHTLRYAMLNSKVKNGVGERERIHVREVNITTVLQHEQFVYYY